jgi:hypothetical protein
MLFLRSERVAHWWSLDVSETFCVLECWTKTWWSMNETNNNQTCRTRCAKTDNSKQTWITFVLSKLIDSTIITKRAIDILCELLSRLVRNSVDKSNREKSNVINFFSLALEHTSSDHSSRTHSWVTTKSDHALMSDDEKWSRTHEKWRKMTIIEIKFRTMKWHKQRII